MSVALKDRSACEYVLRILTGDPHLEVVNVRSQYRISNLISHDAVLDIFAETADGGLYNLEVQRRDTVDHLRRTRFYGAIVDNEFLRKGKQYSELKELNIIYISQTDIFHSGTVVSHWKKELTGTALCNATDTEIACPDRKISSSKKYDDGLHVWFVNAEICDGSAIADLMKYFLSADPNDMRHGALSKRIHFLKSQEQGVQLMCEVSEKLVNIGKEIGRKEGLETGRKEGLEQGFEISRKSTITNMHKLGFSIRDIAAVIGP